MNCRKARQLIPYAADGGLSDSELVELHGHVSCCTCCAGSLEAHRSSILELEGSLHSTANQITTPEGFASLVVMRIAESDAAHDQRVPAAVQLSTRLRDAIFTSRRAAVATACAAILAATLVTSAVIDRELDSSPVASTKVYSGHLVAFTVNPRPDGRVVAGVDTHRYCQIVRPREEALR